MGCASSVPSQAPLKEETTAPTPTPQPETDAEQTEDAKTPAEGARQVAVRKEIRTLSETETSRFVAALLRMMKPADSRVPSEYFRIAGYHGWPTDYCQHGLETFPAWHRLYLVEMEQALRQADRDNGNDGNIGLPYWDWSRESVNGQVLPSFLKKEFDAIPEPLLKEMLSAGADLGGRTHYMRREDDDLAWRLESSDVAALAEDCLREEQHWKHASTRWGGGTSVETPHNRIHVAVGWPMSTVEFAA